LISITIEVEALVFLLLPLLHLLEKIKGHGIFLGARWIELCGWNDSKGMGRQGNSLPHPSIHPKEGQ